MMSTIGIFIFCIFLVNGNALPEKRWTTVFKDIFTSGEVFSDKFQYKLVDDVYYVVTGKIIRLNKENWKNNYGGSMCNIAVQNGLQKTKINKREFKKYLESYLPNILGYVETTNPGKFESFNKVTSQLKNQVLAMFYYLPLYATYGDEEKREGMLLPIITIESDPQKGLQIGDICKMYVLKDGVYQEKVPKNPWEH